MVTFLDFFSIVLFYNLFLRPFITLFPQADITLSVKHI